MTAATPTDTASTATPSSPHPTSTGRPETPSARFRLHRRSHRTLLTAHILTSVGWFGLAVGVAACGISATVTTDPTLPVPLYRLMEAAPWLTIPLGIGAAGTGVVLGLGTRYGLVRSWWVLAKITITITVVVTDAALVRVVARHAAVTGHATTPVYGSTIAHVVVLGVATWLSVFKPFGNTPFARHTVPSKQR
jgi:hypothetical protein